MFDDGNERKAADYKIQGLSQGYGQAADLFQTGRNDAAANYAQARAPLQMLLDQGQRGYGAYADATGVNGLGGLNNARTNFLATPGITEGLNMGLDQIDRRASARGMLGSGNTNMDTLRYGQDYANQKYGDYVSRLAPLAGQSLAPAAGLSGISTGLGNLVNTSLQGQGNLAYGMHTGIGNANAAFELGKDQTGLNQLGAIFGGANLIGKGLGLFGK